MEPRAIGEVKTTFQRRHSPHVQQLTCGTPCCIPEEVISFFWSFSNIACVKCTTRDTSHHLAHKRFKGILILSQTVIGVTDYVFPKFLCRSARCSLNSGIWSSDISTSPQRSHQHPREDSSVFDCPLSDADIVLIATKTHKVVASTWSVWLIGGLCAVVFCIMCWRDASC